MFSELLLRENILVIIDKTDIYIPSERFLVCQKYIPENYWQFDYEIILVY
jgi:hypothetical protein